MAEPLIPKVNRITQTFVTTANGQISPSYLVNFSVGDHGPFSVQIPGADFTAAAVKMAMDKVAAEVNQLTA